jgi:hypothetical protein
MAWGYLGGIVISFIVSPAVAILAALLYLILYIIDILTKSSVGASSVSFMPAFLVATCIGFEVIFWLTAKFFLAWAQRWIADRERTRHWYEEPVYRRSRRPIARAPYAR